MDEWCAYLSGNTTSTWFPIRDTGSDTTTALTPRKTSPTGWSWEAGYLKCKGWSIIWTGSCQGPHTGIQWSKSLWHAGPMGWGNFCAISQSIWRESARDRLHVKEHDGVLGEVKQVSLLQNLESLISYRHECPRGGSPWSFPQVIAEPQGTVEHILETLAQIGGFLLNNRQRTQNEVFAAYSFITVILRNINHQDQTVSQKDQKKEDTSMESKTFIQNKHWQNEGS